MTSPGKIDEETDDLTTSHRIWVSQFWNRPDPRLGFHQETLRFHQKIWWLNLSQSRIDVQNHVRTQRKTIFQTVTRQDRFVGWKNYNHYYITSTNPQRTRFRHLGHHVLSPKIGTAQNSTVPPDGATCWFMFVWKTVTHKNQGCMRSFS